MTTLSGPPKAARVAAWQCSTLDTVMSPSIRSVVSELCQEGWGGVGGRWGRLRETNSDRKRQSEKTTTVFSHLYAKTNVLKENNTQCGVNISTRAHARLIPSHFQEEVIERVHSTGRLPYCCCQRLWIANERGERRSLLIWGVWGIRTNVHYLLPSYLGVKYPLNLLHAAHKKNNVLVLTQTTDCRDPKLHMIIGCYFLSSLRREENNTEMSAKKQNTGRLTVGNEKLPSLNCDW